MEVVGSQALLVLVALQVEAGLGLCQLFVPAMQLGEILEATVGVGELAKLLFKLLLGQALPVFQLVAHDFAHLVRVVGFAEIVGGLAVEVVEHLVAQRTVGLLTFCHGAQRLASHHVAVAVHPRQQTTVADAVPVVFRTVLVAEGVDNLLNGARRILYQERDVGVHLVD